MKKVLVLSLLLVLWSTSASSTVTQAILELPWIGQMPIHEKLGMLSDPGRPEHPVVERTQQAFSTFYGPTWFENFVVDDARYMLAKLYGTFLSSNLPSSISIGKVTISGFQVSLQIEIKGKETVTDATIVWIQDPKKGWMIASLSIL